jgi:hypothetical protein
MYCDIGDIELQLGGSAGTGWEPEDIQAAIQSATTEVKTKLATKILKESLVAWEGESDTPDGVKEATARIAAAILLNRKADQSLTGTTEAAGLYKAGLNMVNDIKNGDMIILDDDGDADRIQTPVAFSTDSRTPNFSMGDEDEGTEGSFDTF